MLCHSDVHRFNLAAGARLVLIDWEYAHVSEPFWDLAGWIANNDETEDFAAQLLRDYLQRPATPDEAARLRTLTWLYDYIGLLWSELYLSLRGSAPDPGVLARTGRLAARLRIEPGSRAPELPAH